MRAKEFTFEAALGTNPKRPARAGSRPARGHEPQKRYVTDRKTGKQYDPDEEFDKLKNSPDFQAQMKRMAQKEGAAEETTDVYRKVFKKNGKPVGEIGIDLEASPGLEGNWYVKHYASGTDYSGYTRQDAIDELKYLVSQGVDESRHYNPLDIPNPDDVHKPMKGDEPVKRGDIVWAQDPHNIATVHAGKVKRIGRTMVFLVLKNGEELAVPHDEVSKNYDMLSKRAHGILNKKGKHVGNYKVDEGKIEPDAPDADAIARKKAREAAQRRREEKAEADADDLSKDYKPKMSKSASTVKVSGKAYGGSSQKDIDESIARMEAELAEHGKASRELCKSSKPDQDLGASMLASCKSQGLRARDGNKSHKLGKSAKSRVKVGGHKIKGQKYGGPLPDWS